MNTSPHLPFAPALAAGSSATAASGPVAAAAQAPLKLLKKLRKQEQRRLFIGWCASWHALGFSF
jgi:hypothetical protein